MAASLSGRSGGHPIGIVLLEQDIPDVRRRKKDRKKQIFTRKFSRWRRLERVIPGKCNQEGEGASLIGGLRGTLNLDVPPEEFIRA